MSNEIYLAVNTINIITIPFKFEPNTYKRENKFISAITCNILHTCSNNLKIRSKIVLQEIIFLFPCSFLKL